MKIEIGKNIANIIIVIMIICVVVGGLYYYKTNINECTKNPLTYGAKQISNLYGYEFEGYGWLKVPTNIQSQKFYFNSENLSVE